MNISRILFLSSCLILMQIVISCDNINENANNKTSDQYTIDTIITEQIDSVIKTNPHPPYSQVKVAVTKYDTVYMKVKGNDTIYEVH